MDETFSHWALARERTVEERFAVELLVEIVVAMRRHKEDRSWRENYEAMRLF